MTFGCFGIRALHIKAVQTIPLPPSSSESQPRFIVICDSIHKLDESTSNGIHIAFLSKSALVFWGCLFAIFIPFFSVVSRSFRTYEGMHWDWMFLVCFALLLWLTAAGAARLFNIWIELEKTTRAILSVPMVDAFRRLPEKWASIATQILLLGRRNPSDLDFLRNLIKQMNQRRYDRCECFTFNPHPELQVIDNTETSEFAMGYYGSNLETILPGQIPKLVDELSPTWVGRNALSAYGGTPAEEKAVQEAKVPKPGSWNDLAEQYLAFAVVLYLAPFFARLRHRAYMLSATTAAILLSATNYMFLPEQLVLYTSAGITFAVLALMSWILIRINSNELVSRINRTTPGRFRPDFAFLVNSLTVIAPLGLVTAAQLTGRMRTILEPFLLVLK